MDEKPFEPSKRKLKKAREKGERPRSSLFDSALLLVGGWLLLWAHAGSLRRAFEQAFGHVTSDDLGESFKEVFLPLLPPLLSLFFAFSLLAIAIHLAQGGWVWAWPKRQKSRFRFTPPVLVVGVLTLVGALTLRRVPQVSGEGLFGAAVRVTGVASGALLLLGVADLFYQRWRFHTEMRMTKQELKDEQKEN